MFLYFAVNVICKWSAARRSVEERGVSRLLSREDIASGETPIVPLSGRTLVIPVDTPHGHTKHDDERCGKDAPKANRNLIQLSHPLPGEQHERGRADGHEAVVEDRPEQGNKQRRCNGKPEPPGN